MSSVVGEPAGPPREGREGRGRPGTVAQVALRLFDTQRDWAGYGEEIRRLGALLQEMRKK